MTAKEVHLTYPPVYDPGLLAYGRVLVSAGNGHEFWVMELKLYRVNRDIVRVALPQVSKTRACPSCGGIGVPRAARFCCWCSVELANKVERANFRDWIVPTNHVTREFFRLALLAEYVRENPECDLSELTRLPMVPA